MPYYLNMATSLYIGHDLQCRTGKIKFDEIRCVSLPPPSAQMVCMVKGGFGSLVFIFSDLVKFAVPFLT